ncbi:ComEC/Rec2 family competence protein [Qipengyuania sediminis]|uniref:ComEC/Rec2 family competence protein n=1 Tax=Qipengyuania sediminis TaxID=1532023 RepID=UPI0010596464|nr:ComEC/Rec2 family competence protein [Qipengyuania sediminis]
MATLGAPFVPLGDGEPAGHAALPRPWQRRGSLSSFAGALEAFLGRAAYDRGPWLAVALAGGIAAWFTLPDRASWLGAMALAAALSAIAWLHWRGRDDRALLRLAAVSLGFAFVLGIALIWARSALIGTPPLAAPAIGIVEGRILAREEQPAEGRVRLTLAVREAATGRAVKVRLNVPLEGDRPGLVEGAVIRTGARLIPPAPPLVPGAYDFARKAWFDGLAATGASYGELVVLSPAPEAGGLGRMQRRLSAHVRAQLGGSPGTIAAAFASGDRGAIAPDDEAAMRDAGLTHLLSISGLHVSALVAAVYLLSIRLLALWPWLALRVRLPVFAAGLGAAAGLGYTLLTGAEVPTVRSCLGAGLVLLALAVGREPLSLRMVAVVAGAVLLLWPEALIGPSFQMSFAAVLAIVALAGAQPVREFLAPRDESWARRIGRRLLLLFATGVVIEAVLTPIVLFHFHRAGAYGAFANVLAIPLVTFAAMPLIALALLFDTVGLGAPLWWLAGKSLELLLAIAHFVAAQPGAVRLMPQIGTLPMLLYVAGMLWLALWRGRVRLLGLPVALGAIAVMLATPTPDILIARDGRQAGVASPGGQLLVLRDSEGYAMETLRESAAMAGPAIAIAETPGARCSSAFCTLRITRGGRAWHLLLARSKHYVDARQLIAACSAADIVIAPRSLPRSCAPRLLKADRRFLAEHGGLSLYLGEAPRLVTVAGSQGDHGWWRPPGDLRNATGGALQTLH